MVEKSQSGKPEKVPVGQRLFDDINLLLILGLGIPIVSYVVWGLLDLANVQVHH